jgi:deazaflavin-dependent oxidoreductase (nitroreductase family)
MAPRIDPVVPARRPGWLMRRLLGVPLLFYRGPLAERIGGRFLVLTTTGRRSGRQRCCGLNYARDGQTVYVASGFGRTDWYRNLLADPQVEVRIGAARWRAEARAVTLPSERRHALDLLHETARHQGPPAAVRPLMRLAGFDYEASVRRLRGPAPEILVVALRPSSWERSLAA